MGLNFCRSGGYNDAAQVVSPVSCKRLTCLGEAADRHDQGVLDSGLKSDDLPLPYLLLGRHWIVDASPLRAGPECPYLVTDQPIRQRCELLADRSRVVRTEALEASHPRQYEPAFVYLYLLQVRVPLQLGEADHSAHRAFSRHAPLAHRDFNKRNIPPRRFYGGCEQVNR